MNAVIYGTAGAVGAAVPKAFAHEGARVFLTGRNIHALNRIADEMPAAGGVAETADVDVLNEHAVTSHHDGIVGKAATVEPVAAGVGVCVMNAPGSVAEVPADAGSVAPIGGSSRVCHWAPTMRCGRRLPGRRPINDSRRACHRRARA